MLPVPVENPRTAVEMIISRQADVFSHVVPMLVNAQAGLPGSRILPGSYYNVPTAIGYQKGSGRAATRLRDTVCTPVPIHLRAGVASSDQPTVGQQGGGFETGRR